MLFLHRYPKGLKTPAPQGGMQNSQTPQTTQTPQNICHMLHINKHAYNTLRSFLESSTKPTYLHNLPRCYTKKVAYVKEGRWSLTFELSDPHIVATLYDRDNSPVMKLQFYGNNPLPTQIHIDGREVTVPPHLVTLPPSEDVPFAIPINLLDVIEKINEYKVEAEVLLKNKPMELKP